MKAVVMAGGEGTRLRPMTSSMPKPLLPVANRPIMEHVLRLLKRHGLSETVVTVQFLASLVKNYFGDGEELGMELTYANEEKPLGTAGSVKNAEEALKDDAFLVISGDALTDFDLTDLIAFHKEKGALVTVCLTRVPNPLEFGITIVDEEGKVERFLEKPTWGQVFSDTVNTGIYVMEPEVFDYVEADTSVDWSGDVFPQLMKEGKPIYGYIAEGYWEDVGTHESYVKAQADVLEGKVDVDLDGFEISPECGSPKVPRSIRTPSFAVRSTSVTTPRSRRTPRFASTPSSGPTWSSRPGPFSIGPSCTTTCTSGSTAICGAV